MVGYTAQADIEENVAIIDPVGESEDTTKVSGVIQSSVPQANGAAASAGGNVARQIGSAFGEAAAAISSCPGAGNKDQIISGSGGPVPDGDAGAGINEDDLDKEFFQKAPGGTQPKNGKLNKGEKRALKFLMKRELEGTGQELDLNKIAKGGDVAELKAYLAGQDRKVVEAGHLNYVETGGGHKAKNVGARGIGNNSNKLMDYKEFFVDESDSD